MEVGSLLNWTLPSLGGSGMAAELDIAELGGSWVAAYLDIAKLGELLGWTGLSVPSRTVRIIIVIIRCWQVGSDTR